MYIKKLFDRISIPKFTLRVRVNESPPTLSKLFIGVIVEFIRIQKVWLDELRECKIFIHPKNKVLNYRSYALYL